MKSSEIKARIASMVDIPLSDIILIKKEGVTPSFEFAKDKFRITYDDVGELTHEFLHACFSPRVPKISKLFNALEDYRISVKAGLYDKELQKENAQTLNDNPNLLKNILEMKVSENEDQNTRMKALGALSLPIGADVKPDDILNSLTFPEGAVPGVGDPQFVQGLIRKAREELLKSPTLYNLDYWANRLEPYLHIAGDDNATGHDGSDATDNASEMEEAKKKEGDNKKSERLAHNFKNNTSAKNIYELNSKQEFVLRKAITKIIQNKEIGKRCNTIAGKLSTKRLGHYPSDYLFIKKTNPSPETVMYLMVDMSGSMLDSKMQTVSGFMNTIRDMNIPNFQVKIRGFNTLLWKDDEIPRDFYFMKDKCMAAHHPEYDGDVCGANDDAHFLKEIIKEINEDRATNKSLLILSDGQPAESGLYEEDDLEEIVNNHLLPSGIPYMSIGIESRSVNCYYPKAKVVDDLDELTDVLNKYTAELIK